jgi:LPS-assembly protein
MGKARGARLEFKGVPVLWAPYFTFPIDDRRKSGFLYPGIGQNSDSGFEIGIPWYWNIAPNQDATIEPRYYTKRGFMLAGQYRFLTRRSRGRLDFEYVPHDKETSERRYQYLFRHTSRPRPQWSTELVVDRVSDDRYFQDFGDGLSQTSRQFLRSSAALAGVGRFWRFELLADDFQVIDPSVTPENEPYRRLPRLVYWLDRPLGGSGLSLSLDSELVYFDRDAGVTGARVDLYPRVYWHGFSNWGFLQPSVGYRFTGYDLDRMGEPGDESPNRGTAIASVDAGLVFDRLTADGDFQTLEPRLFYLYVPYENQDDIPLFDTGEFTFGYSQLFNTSRFAGGDRQSEANQVSVGLMANHYEGPSGRALWSLAMGQIFYFDPQRVQLEQDPEVDEDFSPFLGEFTWHFRRGLSAMIGVQWDWDRNQLDVGTLGANYRGDRGQRVAFEYRFRRDRVDQFDFRIDWPISERWRLLSRVNYSFADNDLLEIQGGVEYESCCWAFRTVLRRYLRNRDGDYRNGIYLELNLKGLASIGTRGQELFRY